MLSTSKPIVKTSQNMQASWVIHEYFRFELLEFVHYWVIFYFHKTVSLYECWLRVYLDSFILPASYPHLWSFLVLQPEYSTRYPGYLRGYCCPGYVCYQTIRNHGIDHRSWKGSSIGQLKIQVLQHFGGQEWYEKQTHISRFTNKCSIPRDKQRLIWDRLQCWLYPSNSYCYLRRVNESISIMRLTRETITPPTINKHAKRLHYVNNNINLFQGRNMTEKWIGWSHSLELAYGEKALITSGKWRLEISINGLMVQTLFQQLTLYHWVIFKYFNPSRHTK